MPNNNNYLKSENFASKTKVYIAIIGILLIIICVLDLKVIPFAIIGYLVLLVYTIWSTQKRKAELSEQLKDLTSDRKSFITNDEESSKIFKKDVEALEMILDKYSKLKELTMICDRTAMSMMEDRQ